MVGSAARIRVLSVTTPSLIGTVEIHPDQRAPAPRWRAGRAIRDSASLTGPDVPEQVDATRGVAHFVVVPARSRCTSVPFTTLVESASTVLDSMRPDVVGGHERLVAHRQHALERSRLGRLPEGVVDLVGRGRLLDDAGERDDRDVRASARAGRRRRSCPSPAGRTSDVALAAPVVVGMIDSAAARARRRSLCGKSRMI